MTSGHSPLPAMAHFARSPALRPLSERMSPWVRRSTSHLVFCAGAGDSSRMRQRALGHAHPPVLGPGAGAARLPPDTGVVLAALGDGLGAGWGVLMSAVRPDDVEAV